MWSKPSNDNKDKQENPKAKPVYAYPARLSRFCRTRSIQETEILGESHWEAHLQENQLWRFNRVDILVDTVDDELVEIRKVKTLYEDLTFFEAIQKLATFELNQPSPLATMIGKNIDDLGVEHYIFTAEQEGWIVFNHRGQPKFAPNGHVQDQGTYKESDLKRAKDRAATAKANYPKLFEGDIFDITNNPIVKKQTTQEHKPLPSISGQQKQLLEDVIPLAEVFNQKNTPQEEVETYKYIEKMDLAVAELRKFKQWQSKLRRNPSGYEINMFMPWDDTYVALAQKHCKAAKKYALSATKDVEQKKDFEVFFKKLELDFYVFMGRAWREDGASTTNTKRIKRGKSEMKSYISKIQKSAKKAGLESIDTQALELTLFEAQPAIPESISTFISEYKSWREDKVRQLKRPEQKTVKTVFPKR